MKIDIAKILENAPKGIKLYSPAYGIVELEEVKNTLYYDGTLMATEIKTKSLYSRKSVSFDYQGRLSIDGECMLFPGRDGADWDSWQRWLMPQSKGSYVVDCYGGVFRIRESGWRIEDSGGNAFEMSPEEYCKGGDGFRYATKEEVEFFENNEKKNKKKNKRTIIKCDDADNVLDSKWWWNKPDAKHEFCVGDILISKDWTVSDKECEKYLITNIDEYSNYVTLNLLTNNNKWFSRAFAEEKLRKWTPFDMQPLDFVTCTNPETGFAEWIGVYDKMDNIQIETFNFFEFYNIISDCFYTSGENYPAYTTATDKDDFNHIRPSTESEKELFLKEYAKFFGLDDASDCFIIHIGEKYNVVDSKYHIVSDIWFDWVWDFNEGFAAVTLNDRYNFINTEGQLLSSQWFDYVGDFSEGFAGVKLNDKLNFINTEGKLLSQQWFDDAWSFNEGFASVKLNNKWNFINKKGDYLSPQWFGWVDDFFEGFAAVGLNNKWNFINKENEYLSQQWFDFAENFKEGFAMVELNRKRYYLDTKGQLCDYGTKEVLSASINVQEDSFNNWSIKCAQPGDVLSSKHYVFIYKGINS